MTIVTTKFTLEEIYNHQQNFLKDWFENGKGTFRLDLVRKNDDGTYEVDFINTFGTVIGTVSGDSNTKLSCQMHCTL